MAKFYSGNWKGMHYKVEPIGIRKHLQFFGISLPYISGDKIKFSIKITKWDDGNCPKLNQLDIWERFIPDMSVEKPVRERQIETLRGLSDNAKIGKFPDEAYITGKYAEYWLGYPEGADSHPLIKADLIPSGEFYMKFVLPAFVAFVSSVLTYTITYIINFINSLR